MLLDTLPKIKNEILTQMFWLKEQNVVSKHMFTFLRFQDSVMMNANKFCQAYIQPQGQIMYAREGGKNEIWEVGKQSMVSGKWLSRFKEAER